MDSWLISLAERSHTCSIFCSVRALSQLDSVHPDWERHLHSARLPASGALWQAHPDGVRSGTWAPTAQASWHRKLTITCVDVKLLK